MFKFVGNFVSLLLLLLVVVLVAQACQSTPASTLAVDPTVTPLPPTVTSRPTQTPLPPTATLRPTQTPLPPTATLRPTRTPVPIILEGGKSAEGGKSEVTITYICNDGFLFTSSSGEKIFIDGLQAEIPEFGMFMAEQRILMGEARPPYDGIDLILFTHDDGDHYDFDLIRKYMENSPDTALVAAEEGAAPLKELFPDRVQAVRLDEWEKQAFSINGIDLEVIGLRHSDSSYDYTHVGLLFTIGGWRILHTGDFDNTTQLPSDLGEIDVAFINYWAVEPPAKHVIYMHYPPASSHKPMQTWILK
jgi:L-ascorbate metabolism protein UlaG (beta-lactamase superfamily)